jgi:hypothetical protein
MSIEIKTRLDKWFLVATVYGANWLMRTLDDMTAQRTRL